MIREFTPASNNEDFKLLLPAYLELVNEENALKYLNFTHEPFTEAQVSAWFSSHLQDGVQYFVDIEMGNEINGIAIVKSDTSEECELLGLVVRPSSQNSGIDTGLVRYTLQKAEDMKRKTIRVSVFADNQPMLALLEKYNFIIVSKTCHARSDGMDLVYLRLIFSTEGNNLLVV